MALQRPVLVSQNDYDEVIAIRVVSLDTAPCERALPVLILSMHPEEQYAAPFGPVPRDT